MWLFVSCCCSFGLVWFGLERFWGGLVWVWSGPIYFTLHLGAFHVGGGGCCWDGGRGVACPSCLGWAFCGRGDGGKREEGRNREWKGLTCVWRVESNGTCKKARFLTPSCMWRRSGARCGRSCSAKGSRLIRWLGARASRRSKWVVCFSVSLSVVSVVFCLAMI